MTILGAVYLSLSFAVLSIQAIKIKNAFLNANKECYSEDKGYCIELQIPIDKSTTLLIKYDKVTYTLLFAGIYKDSGKCKMHTDFFWNNLFNWNWFYERLTPIQRGKLDKYMNMTHEQLRAL